VRTPLTPLVWLRRCPVLCMTAHRSVACGVHDPLLACSRIRSEESRRRQDDARFTVQVSVTSRFAPIRTEELEAEADRKARSPVGSTLRPEGLILRRATVPDRVPLVSRVVSTPAPRDLFCLCGPTADRSRAVFLVAECSRVVLVHKTPRALYACVRVVYAVSA